MQVLVALVALPLVALLLALLSRVEDTLRPDDAVRPAAWPTPALPSGLAEDGDDEPLRADVVEAASSSAAVA